jgi:hypothetical protein
MKRKLIIRTDPGQDEQEDLRRRFGAFQAMAD